jgi:hypothetical protein
VSINSDSFGFGRLSCGVGDAASNVIGYGKTAPTMIAVIRVYDEAGNVIETHEHAGEFEEP